MLDPFDLAGGVGTTAATHLRALSIIVSEMSMPMQRPPTSQGTAWTANRPGRQAKSTSVCDRGRPS
jgi:hypothetical protein